MRQVVGSIAKMLERAGPLLERLPHGPCMIVEVGVGSGIMAEHLLSRRDDLIWYGVDSWLAGDAQPEAYRATGDTHAGLTQDAQDQLMMIARKRIEKFGQRAAIVHQSSPGAGALFSGCSQDLVFLDGDHSFDGCLDDCRAWWPKIKIGGWLGGHDFGQSDPRFRFGVDEAVRQFSTEVGVPFQVDGGMTWWMRRL